MKLIIQIPCYNEEETLAISLAALPQEIKGIDCVEWLLINDGSADQSVEIAQSNGVHHIINLNGHQGLARAFMAGIDRALRAGADIIVNTDADNQYCADDIPKLIEPIILGKADIVIGARPIDQIKHFSATKKLLQKFGSFIVRLASSTNVIDAPSGFRAISRDAAMQLNVFNQYTYTLEMIIQAAHRGLHILSVPIRTNDDLRPSKLIKSTGYYIQQSIFTIVRALITYKPLLSFLLLGSIPFIMALLLVIYRLLFYRDSLIDMHFSGLLLGVLIIIGVQLWIFGLVANLIAINRRIIEDTQLRTRRMEYDAQRSLKDQPNINR